MGFDMEDRSFFTACTLVVAVLGGIGLYALSLTEVPGGTYAWAVISFSALILCIAAALFYFFDISARLFPVFVALGYLTFIPALNSLSGSLFIGDVFVGGDIAWYGKAGWQTLTFVTIAASGYFLMSLADRPR